MKRGFDLNLGLEEEGEGEEWGNSPLGQEEEEGEESGDSQKGPALDINALAGGEEEEGAPGGWTEVEGEVTRRSNEEEGNQGEDDDDGEEEQEDEEQEEEEDEEGGEAAAAAAREDAEGVDEAAADIEAELERGEDEDERDGRPTGGSKSAITDREMRDAGQERPGTGRRGHEGSAERPQEGDGGVDGLGVGRGDRDQEEDGGGLGGAESDGSDYNAVDEDDDRAAPGAAEAGSGEARLPASGTEDASKGSAKENPELPPPPKRRFVIKKRPVGARKPESQGPSGVGGGAPVRGVGGASVRDVAEHYSARENQRVDVRESSPIIHLKKLNNWIKSVLIRRYTQPGDYVLDLACGKGGDLIKWDFAKIGFYLGIDVAKGSIYDAAGVPVACSVLRSTSFCPSLPFILPLSAPSALLGACSAWDQAQCAWLHGICNSGRPGWLMFETRIIAETKQESMQKWKEWLFCVRLCLQPGTTGSRWRMGA